MSDGPGRRSGSPDTRREILEAARRTFSEVGYDRATLRTIAGEAKVDPALIHHYFGSKSGLFAETLDLPFPPRRLIETMISVDSGDIGLTLAQNFFAIWEQEPPRRALLGLLRSAIGGEDQAVAAFREFMTEEIQAGLAPLIERDDAEIRALLMASHLVGVAMTRYVVRFEPIASASVDQLVTLVAPRLQSYLED